MWLHPGIWENIILTITPTLDGVCGMLLYIILNFVFCQIGLWTIVLDVLNQLLLLWWLVIVSPLNQWSLWQMLLPCFVMADVIAISLFIGYCCCQLCYGWCYCHYVLYWLMLLPIMLWLMLLPLCYMAITSAINSIGLMVTQTPITIATKVDLKYPKLWFTILFGKKTKFKIIYNNIPHTPSKVGVMVSIIFSHTPGWSHVSWTGKSLCSEKNLFCYREN